MQKNIGSVNNAKQVVMSFVEALGNQDYKSARSYASDNMSFLGPLASHDSADAYFKDMERLRLPKFEIKKVVADGNDVCLFYDLNVGTPPVAVFVCGWYHVNDEGKISSLRVVFDPRHFLQQQQQKK
ncbi:SnoaL-like domain [Candidatus Nitrososphaera evergladensis SR1]|jgi:limonene-1,2-epoxide hydrolase|uniref:SnoaL-like domain n=1 Tax=Candidatus Nitrososphaera evergladensis SR1 TaxID=1459636 RepID=A0A075MR72_9ARCH|nr:nuclear transport factor 2 family protein [Candidatus Nitrososphaera evergladensis]AIF84061.1 SnoaL-like domain [Candidatus Nitrososphaera evergladensis SR1]